MVGFRETLIPEQSQLVYMEGLAGLRRSEGSMVVDENGLLVPLGLAYNVLEGMVQASELLHTAPALTWTILDKLSSITSLPFRICLTRFMCWKLVATGSMMQDQDKRDIMYQLLRSVGRVLGALTGVADFGDGEACDGAEGAFTIALQHLDLLHALAESNAWRDTVRDAFSSSLDEGTVVSTVKQLMCQDGVGVDEKAITSLLATYASLGGIPENVYIGRKAMLQVDDHAKVWEECTILSVDHGLPSGTGGCINTTASTQDKGVQADLAGSNASMYTVLVHTKPEAIRTVRADRLRSKASHLEGFVTLILEDEDLPERFCRSFELLFPNSDTGVARGIRGPPPALLLCLRSQGMRALSKLLTAHPALVHSHGSRLFPVILKPLNLAATGQQVVVSAMGPFLPDTELVAPISLPAANTLTGSFETPLDVRPNIDYIAFCSTGTRSTVTSKEKHSGKMAAGSTIHIPCNTFDLVWHVGNVLRGNNNTTMGWTMRIKSSSPVVRSEDGMLREMMYDLGGSSTALATLSSSSSSSMEMSRPPPDDGVVTPPLGKLEEKCNDATGVQELIPLSPFSPRSILHITTTDMCDDPELTAKGITEYWVKVAGKGDNGSTDGAVQEEFPLQVEEKMVTAEELRASHDSVFDCSLTNATSSPIVGEGKVGGKKGGGSGYRGSPRALVRTQAHVSSLKHHYIHTELTCQSLSCLATLVVAWLKDVDDVNLSMFGGGIVSFFEVMELLITHGKFSKDVVPYLRAKLLITSEEGKTFAHHLAHYALQYLWRKSQEDSEKRMLTKLLPVILSSCTLSQEHMSLAFTGEACKEVEASCLSPAIIYLAQGSVVAALRPGGLVSDQGVELSWVLCDLLYHEVVGGKEGMDKCQLALLLQSLTRCLSLVPSPDIRLVHLLTAILSTPKAVIPEAQQVGLRY